MLVNEAARTASGFGTERGIVTTAVRRATADDAEAIAVLQDMANEGHLSAHDWRVRGRDWRSVGAEIIASDRTEMGIGHTIVAERDGTVVGMLNYAPSDPPDLAVDETSSPFIRLRAVLHPCLYLRSMAVMPNARGDGIAGRLLDVATVAASATSQHAIGVVVHESNAALLRHYERRGFQRAGTEAVLAHHSYPVGSTLLALRRPMDA